MNPKRYLRLMNANWSTFFSRWDARCAGWSFAEPVIDPDPWSLKRRRRWATRTSHRYCCRKDSPCFGMKEDRSGMPPRFMIAGANTPPRTIKAPLAVHGTQCGLRPQSAQRASSSGLGSTRSPLATETSNYIWGSCHLGFRNFILLLPCTAGTRVLPLQWYC